MSWGKDLLIHYSGSEFARYSDSPTIHK